MAETYQKPSFLFNRHIETIYPALFRSVDFEYSKRERIDTPDGDFIDTDWHYNSNKKLAIICHGLEGDAHRPYVRGLARALSKLNCDSVGINYRGCSGEMNRTTTFYHSGATADIALLVEYALKKELYTEIIICGFSLGGNLTLKYLGEQGKNIPEELKAGIVFSTPLHLESCSYEMLKPHNKLYTMRFMKKLKGKVIEKSKTHPDLFSLDQLKEIKNIFDFDDKITGPLHGFESAIDYYTKCSSMYFLDGISIPVAIVNAYNDSFLSEESFDIKKLSDNKNISYEFTTHGGHCGFTEFNKEGYYWSEMKALDFFSNIIS